MATPFLTGLPRVLDTAGVQWTGAPGWQTRTAYSGRGMREVHGVIVHGTETANAAFRSGADAPTFEWVHDASNSRRGGPSYNMLIGRSGHVHLMCAGPAQHAGVGSWPTDLAPNPGVPRNSGHFHLLGISLDANDGQYPPTEAQLVALVKVLAALRDEWGGRFTVMMHGEWARERTTNRRFDLRGVPGGWDAIRKAVDAGGWNTTKTPTARPARPAGTLGFVIRRGDMLWQIAADLGTTVAAIRAATPGLDPDRIRPGQTVHVPARRHTVAAGDTLGTIATRTGGTVQGLARVNGVADPHQISAGQTLVVPA